MTRLAFAAVLLRAGAADAKVFEVYAQAQGGGGYGQGIAGAQKDNAFHRQQAGGMYGIRAGAEILFFDGWIEHQQFTDVSEVPTGTWTQFMLGGDMDFPLGDEPLDKKQRRKAF